MSGGYHPQPGQPGPYGHQPGQPHPQVPPQPPAGGPPPAAPYPGQAWPPGPPGPPGPPPGKGRSPLVPALAIALVLALVVGGAWFLLNSDDEDSGGGPPVAVDPATPGGQVWSVNEEGENASASPNGHWMVGDTLVKAAGTVLTAYALADGSPVWTLDLDGNHLCTPTTATSDGVIVVGHGENNCGQNVTRIDLTSGETGWSQRLEPQSNPLSFEIAMTESSYATQTVGGWTLHRVADGEVISSGGAMYNTFNEDVNDTDYTRERPLVTDSEICAVDGVAGGETLLRRRTCATVIDADSARLTDPFFRLEEIDPDTGDTRWSLDLPRGRWLSKVVSSAPLTVLLRDEQFGGNLELAVVEDGAIARQIPLTGLGFSPDDMGLVIESHCLTGTVVYSPLDDCGGMVVNGNTLYTSPGTFSGDPVVTAFDLAGGELLWSYQPEHITRQLVIGTDGAGILVHQAGYRGEAGQVVRLAPHGETAEPLFRTDDLLLPGTTHVAFTDGQLVLSHADHSAESDIAAYGPQGTLPEPADGADGAGDATP